MISFNHGNTLHRRMVEEHDFNAEQANGTLMIVDEMVDSGIDRVLASIAGLESKMDKNIADLASKMDKSIAELRSEMDLRFNSIDKQFVAVDKQFMAVEKQFTAAEKQFTAAEKQFTAVDKRIKEQSDVLKDALNELSTWLPVKNVLYTIGVIALIVTIVTGLPQLSLLFD